MQAPYPVCQLIVAQQLTLFYLPTRYSILVLPTLQPAKQYYSDAMVIYSVKRFAEVNE